MMVISTLGVNRNETGYPNNFIILPLKCIPLLTNLDQDL
jgi:hypothetical protein